MPVDLLCCRFAMFQLSSPQLISPPPLSMFLGGMGMGGGMGGGMSTAVCGDWVVDMRLRRSRSEGARRSTDIEFCFCPFRVVQWAAEPAAVAAVACLVRPLSRVVELRCDFIAATPLTPFFISPKRTQVA